MNRHHDPLKAMPLVWRIRLHDRLFLGVNASSPGNQSPPGSRVSSPQGVICVGEGFSHTPMPLVACWPRAGRSILAGQFLASPLRVGCFDLPHSHQASFWHSDAVHVVWADTQVGPYRVNGEADLRVDPEEDDPNVS